MPEQIQIPMPPRPDQEAFDALNEVVVSLATAMNSGNERLIALAKQDYLIGFWSKYQIVPMQQPEPEPLPEQALEPAEQLDPATAESVRRLKQANGKKRKSARASKVPS